MRRDKKVLEFLLLKVSQMVWLLKISAGKVKATIRRGYCWFKYSTQFGIKKLSIYALVFGE